MSSQSRKLGIATQFTKYESSFEVSSKNWFVNIINSLCSKVTAYFYHSKFFTDDFSCQSPYLGRLEFFSSMRQFSIQFKKIWENGLYLPLLTSEFHYVGL